MPILYGQVNNIPNASVVDGTNQPALQGKAGDLIVSELHGKWFTQSYRGNVFSLSSPIAGTAVGTATSTNMTSCTLWNPLGSGKVFELISVDINVLATIGIGGFALSSAVNLGANAGTGAPVISFTSVSAINTNVGSGNVSVSKTAAGAFSVTTAPVLFTNLGVSTASSTAGTGSYLTRIDIDGKIVVAPGSAISLVAAAATTAAASFVWCEVPV